MLSGTIQLLLEEQKSNDVATRPSTWRDHVGRLMVRLGGVYTRAMLSILVGETWIDLLVSETTLPLRERLAIALLFLPDEEVHTIDPRLHSCLIQPLLAFKIFPIIDGRHESFGGHKRTPNHWTQPRRPRCSPSIRGYNM